MSLFYIKKSFNEIHNLKIYSYYKEDLVKVYNHDYKITEIQLRLWLINYVSLPYLIRSQDEQQIFIDGNHEEWKNDLLKSSKRIEIVPLSLEDYFENYAPIIYYITKGLSYSKKEIYSIYRDDLASIYPDEIILSKKFSHINLNIFSQSIPLPYIQVEGITKSLIHHPPLKYNWKEDIMVNNSNVRIRPYSYEKFEADKEFVSKVYKECLSELEHYDNDSFDDNLTDETNKIETDYFIDDFGNCRDNNYCQVCDSSPCMCSDPDRTSTARNRDLLW